MTNFIKPVIPTYAYIHVPVKNAPSTIFVEDIVGCSNLNSMFFILDVALLPNTTKKKENSILPLHCV